MKKRPLPMKNDLHPFKKKTYPGKETYIHGKRHTSSRRELLP